MKNIKRILLVSLIAALGAGAGSIAVWWQLRPHSATAAASPVAYKYTSLEKTIVMLRGRVGDPAQHFLALDLVFRSPAASELSTRDQLPLLRSVAVRTLAHHTLDSAAALSIDQLADELNHAFKDSYAKEQREQPFVEAMVGKFLIE